MVSANDVGCSIFLLVLAVPVLPWWEFSGEMTLGIDLGTTYSVASICVDKKPRAVTMDYNTTMVPSMVAFTDGKVQVGMDAEATQLNYPENVIAVSKRFIGLQFDDESVQHELKEVQYDVVPLEGSGVAVASIPGKGIVKPEDVAGLILKKLKEKAEKEVGWFKSRMGFRFYTATISVPVSFSGPQRAATHRAAKQAGFSMVRLIEEPVAAAVAYGLDQEEGCDVIVYDMGGGTLDVALLRLQRDTKGFLLMSTAGEANLGGSDFDRCIAHHLADQHGSTLASLRSKERAIFLRSVEAAKRALSSDTTATLTTPWGSSTITRDGLKQACAQLITRAMLPVDDVIKGASVRESMLHIVLAGGSSRLTVIRELLTERFGAERIHSSLDADLAISLGASKAYGC